MSITDELRKWGYGFCGSSYEVVNAIADRIDAEHQKAMSRAGQLLADAERDRDYNYANWQECKQRVLQGNITIDELNARIECLEDALSHCIEWPKDADGEPWRLGDKLMMEGEVCEVVGIGGHTIFYAFGNGVEWTIAHNNRHHHAPTVEDVLREFVAEFIDYATCIDDHEVTDAIEQYAAKLQLREDA